MESKSAMTWRSPRFGPLLIRLRLRWQCRLEAIDQAAEPVIVLWLPSLKVANRAELLRFTFRKREPFGVTAIDTKAAGPTVRVTEDVTEPEVAVRLALPTSLPNARPDWSILATEG